MRIKFILILILGAGFTGILAEKSLKEKAYEYYSSISPSFKQYEEKLEPAKFSNLGMETMTNEGMLYLVVFFNLEILNIDDSSVTDEGLKRISEIPKLRYLSLMRTTVGNKGCEYISKSKSITSLTLDEMKNIDDGCITHLMKMKQLRSLSVALSNISDKAVRKIRKAIPLLNVTTEQG
ncbi:hypothetical protein HGB47_16885 [Leptospira yasudae]|uniref:hypothetical protein n=1 Tax=Leptospira yasudae TaxID=2202201 RepID=UPI001C4FB7DF|nr:hypothetical protein [Leptospira yasudae]MBW0435287.1 hypothetical protein [Leptospira yasudae]